MTADTTIKAVKLVKAADAEARRFIVAALTHLRDNGDFKGRAQLLDWGQDILRKYPDRHDVTVMSGAQEATP